MAITLSQNGTLFVLSAPSGGGKSTVLSALLKQFDNLDYSISVTSRAPRGKEKDGVDFDFVSKDEFQRMIDAKEFYEWAKVHGNYYGTRRATVDGILADGRDVAMDIDVQGACAIKGMRPDAVTIFLLPPSMQVLERRLRGRETDTDEAIQVRLKNAAEEVSRCNLFDYLVLNDDLDHVIKGINSIVRAERLRSTRRRLHLQDEPAIEKLLGNV